MVVNERCNGVERIEGLTFDSGLPNLECIWSIQHLSEQNKFTKLDIC